MLLLAFIPAHADISQAIGYLAAQQNADGSYGDSPSAIATPVQGTSEALRAFQVTDTAVPPYAPALAYLNASTENNTEFLARKIIVNAGGGLDVSVLLGDLLLRQDPLTGGFGDTDAAPNVLDIAFALQALAAAGYGNNSEAVNALNYLLSRQDI
jgi:prenyltransferase beta subunit